MDARQPRRGISSAAACSAHPRRFFPVALSLLCAVAPVGVLAQQAPPSPPAAPAAPPENRVFSLREQGDRAYAAGDYDVARRFYRDYLAAAYSKDVLVDAILRVAKSDLAVRAYDDGLSLLENAPERVKAFVPANPAGIAPDSYRLTAEQQALLLYWSARFYLAKGNFQEATTRFVRAAAGVGDNTIKAQALLGAADCYAGQQNWPAAAESYAQVEQLGVSDTLRHNAALGRIEALVAQRKYVEAQALSSALLDQVEGKQQVRAGVYHLLTLMELDKVPDAFAFFRDHFAEATGLLDEPEHYPILRRLALALAKAANYDAALFVLERTYALAKTEPQKQELLLDLAETAAAGGKREVAIERLSTFIKLYPRDPRLPHLRFRIGRYFEQLERVKEAVPFYQLVLEDTKAGLTDRYNAAMQLGNLYREKMKLLADHLDLAIKLYYEASKLPVETEQKAWAIYSAAEVYYFDLNDYHNAAIFYQNVADTFAHSSRAEESRFKQGLARQKGKRYPMAAAAFKLFLEQYPESPRRAAALFSLGTSLYWANDYPEAIDTFRSFVADFPASEDAPLALVHASDAAFKTDDSNLAISLLSEVIDKYPESKHYPYALYRRAYLRLSVGLDKEALEDSYDFIRKFADTSVENRERAADVYLWLGDYFAGEGDHEQAARFFAELPERFPDSKDAPDALYEAAKNAYNQAMKRDMNRQDLTHAVGYLGRLADAYPEAPVRIRARARYLRGDIESISGNFARAATWFEDCAALVPRTALYYAALGRLGDCNYSLATSDEENSRTHYEKALASFREVIGAETVSHSLVEMARYRAAKVYERLGQAENARDQYYRIFYDYQVESDTGKLTDWYYFSRAGFDLARLFLANEQYLAAIRVYERLCKAGIPTGGDACRRAEELRNAYGE